MKGTARDVSVSGNLEPFIGGQVDGKNVKDDIFGRFCYVEWWKYTTHGANHC